MQKKLALSLTAAAAIAMLSSGIAANAVAGDEKEKCAGVVAKGKNDCSTKAHSCAGQSKEDRAADEWVFTSKGLCERLAGGKVLAE